MINFLEQCHLTEIAPDVWHYEGFQGSSFFLEPPSGSIFFLRDGDMVMMMDSGHHPFQRKKILEVLNKLRKEGAKELVLVMSHGHWDHGKNNDVIYEAGYEKVRFLLPENEFNTLNIPVHMTGSYAKAREYYDPCTTWHDNFHLLLEWFSAFPEFNDPKYQSTWEKIRTLPKEYDSNKVFEAYVSLMKNVMCPDIRPYCIDKAAPLHLKDRVKRKYGDTILLGWPLGRFFLIHDASQSPGHISIYDPLHKLMITGDATLEINPPFIDGDLGNSMQICQQCLQMTKAGYIKLATDSHRTSQWWARNFKLWDGMEPIAPVELVDVARGQKECADFYRMWLDYFGSLWEAVIRAHASIGEATIPEIVSKMEKSADKYMKFKLVISLPRLPSSADMLVAKVLMETGAKRRVDGNRVLFSPAVGQ
jgi:glyoxylase-like metal-dependent hydrolase (beta-lactamase superfamily II)